MPVLYAKDQNDFSLNLTLASPDKRVVSCRRQRSVVDV